MKNTTIFMFLTPLIISIFNLATSCNNSGSDAPTPPAQPEYQLAWTDDFNGTQLDMTYWEYSLNNRTWRSGYNDATAVSVSNGNLVIQPYTDVVNGVTTHHTGYLATKRKDFLYGRFEAKIAFVNEPASWSAFWLVCPNMGVPIGNPKQAGMEMDIVESLPNDGRVYQTLHWDGYGADHKKEGFVTDDLGCNSGNFHIYEMEWTPDYYKFYVDGKLTYTYKDNVSQRTEYILLTTEIADNYWTGSIPSGGYGAKGQGKTIMKVDYVKYYSLKQ